MSPRCLAGLTIVVVEDHDEARMCLGGFLRRIGATPVLAAGPAEGLRAVKKWLPDLVLTNTRMPEGDDLQWLQKIRALKSSDSRGMPIIAMSAMISKEEVARMQKAGFSACLRKPFSPKRLVETILNLASH